MANEFAPGTYLNLMDQCRLCYRADEIPELEHPLSRDEFESVRTIAMDLGFHRLEPADCRKRKTTHLPRSRSE